MTAFLVSTETDEDELSVNLYGLSWSLNRVSRYRWLHLPLVYTSLPVSLTVTNNGRLVSILVACIWGFIGDIGALNGPHQLISLCHIHLQRGHSRV